MSFKRVAAAVALPAGVALSALFAVPAQAAVPADGIVTNADGSKTETKSVLDGGDIKYTISVKWNATYIDAAGAKRVSVNPLVVYRPDSITPAFAEDDGVDLHFDVQELRSGSYVNIQHKLFDNIDLDVATDDQASFNPRNPKSNIDDTRIRVKVGTDGDGLPSSAWVYFVQPEGLPAA
jgi:hypothetical protein